MAENGKHFQNGRHFFNWGTIQRSICVDSDCGLNLVQYGG